MDGRRADEEEQTNIHNEERNSLVIHSNMCSAVLRINEKDRKTTNAHRPDDDDTHPPTEMSRSGPNPIAKS